MGALRFGLIPRGDGGEKRERAFVDAMASALGADVDVHRAADYRMVLSGLERALVDFAWLPPLVGARALRGGLADLVAVVVRAGDTQYATVLVTRVDSGIHGLPDLRGLRAGWVDRESASGYAVLRRDLARAGVQLTSAFAVDHFLRSHAAVARAVLDRQVDVGATCAHADEGGLRFARSPFAGDLGLSVQELRAIFQGGPVPSDLFAVRRDAPPAVRSVLERVLLHKEPAEAHEAARALAFADAFATPTPSHRRMLEDLIEPG